MSARLAVGVIAVLSLVALVLVFVLDLSVGRMLTEAPERSRPDVTFETIDAEFAGADDPVIGPYFATLSKLFPKDYKHLIQTIETAAESGVSDAEVARIANETAFRITSEKARFTPYASAENVAVYFDNKLRELELARSQFGDEVCAETARHGSAVLNARILQDLAPEEATELLAGLTESGRRLLFVMKEGQESGMRPLDEPTQEDWEALDERMREAGARPAHFAALRNPQAADAGVLCEAGIYRMRSLAALSGPAAETLRPFIAKRMIGG